MTSSSSGSYPTTRHQEALDAFLSLAPEQRYAAMKVGLSRPGYVPDEVVTTMSRRACMEVWPDERRYTQVLVQRLYRHVRGHVGKNPGWSRRAGGFVAATDDFVQYVNEHLAKQSDPVCYAENYFGDWVYKRCLDYADELYGKKKLTTDSNDAENEDVDVTDNEESFVPSVLDSLIESEEGKLLDARLAQVLEAIDDENLLSDKERVAITFHLLGQLRIDSKDASKLTVCKLMNCSEKSARIYIKNAIAKIKEKFQ